MCGKQMLKLESLVIQALCIGANITLFLVYYDTKRETAAWNSWKIAKRLFLYVTVTRLCGCEWAWR